MKQIMRVVFLRVAVLTTFINILICGGRVV